MILETLSGLQSSRNIYETLFFDRIVVKEGKDVMGESLYASLLLYCFIEFTCTICKVWIELKCICINWSVFETDHLINISILGLSLSVIFQYGNYLNLSSY